MRDEEGRARPAHELSDVRTTAVVQFGLGLLACTVAVFLIIWGLFHYLAGREEKAETPPVPMATGDRLPPEPRLQGAPGHELHPVQEMKRMVEAQEAVLRGYGWVDRNAGIVRIPIERAMEKLLEQGFPVRSEQKEQPGQVPEKKQ